MDKDEAVKNFFIALKVTLKSAAIYHSEHGAISTAIEHLKKKVDSLLETSDQIKIGFTPQALRVDERYLKNEKIYEEIARIFHQRKIKTLELHQGLRSEELRDFILNFQLPPKEIARRGGLKSILKQEDVTHLLIEELDYSQLLKGEGEELADVWTYLLEDALNERNPQKMDDLADSFDRVVTRVNPEEIDQNERLGVNFSRFFSYLKENNEAKFKKCAKDLVRAVIRNKSVSVESNLERLKTIVTDLTEKDLAPILYEEMISNDDFDALGFSLFSKLTEGDRDQKISAALTKLAQKDLFLSTMSDLKDKIKKLLSGTESTFISENYRKSLGLLLEGVSFEKKRSFDQNLLTRNFHFVLLNLLSKETQIQASADLTQVLLKEWDSIAAERDFNYLRNLFDLLQQKKGILANDAAALKLETLLCHLVESAILQGKDMPVFEYFIDSFRASVLDVNVYLRKIFTEQKITPCIIRAFFKFHSDLMLYFNINLGEKVASPKFIELMIKNLQTVDSPLSLMALKHIFPLSENRVRIRILRAMRDLSECDEKFLFPILKKGDWATKKEVVAILAKFPPLRQRVFKRLFSFPSPFGLRNHLLLDHLRIVKDLELNQAGEFVLPLAERRFFWDKKLREEALGILEDWDARKN